MEQLPDWYVYLGGVACVVFALAAYIVLGDGSQDTAAEQWLWPPVVVASGWGALEFWKFVGRRWMKEWNRARGPAGRR
jgi:hypothetical protein